MRRRYNIGVWIVNTGSTKQIEKIDYNYNFLLNFSDLVLVRYERVSKETILKKINKEDINYPKMLKRIENAPEVLYINGNIELLESPCIAVIGSRNCTKYGEKWCEFFVKEFVKYGLTIVSGMALGIDSIAHKTALKYGGNTIAVLPCGFNNIFPEENIELYNEIIEKNGAVITEYELNTKAEYQKFLDRNRIVSGLSMGVLVVEAAYRSGTTVTARDALKQKRDVFCIPRKLRKF